MGNTAQEILMEEGGFSSPNTYDPNFGPLPSGGGVYIISTFSNEDLTCEILYIGSAKNIKNRVQGHEILRILAHFYEYLRINFKECEPYREVEKGLIRRYRPRFNKAHNG